MTRISLFLPDPQLAQLRAVAESLDLPLAEVIRRALAEYLTHTTPSATSGAE